MKILLIEPAKASLTLGGEDVFVYEPLALEYLAAGVPDPHEARTLDQRLDKDVTRVLDEYRPGIVGISSYTVHVGVVRALCERVKTRFPHTLTVVGGHRATVAPHDFVAPFIDLVVVGEGVFAFKTVVERHARGESFDGIPGVARQRAGALVMEAPPAASPSSPASIARERSYSKSVLSSRQRRELRCIADS